MPISKVSQNKNFDDQVSSQFFKINRIKCQISKTGQSEIKILKSKTLKSKKSEPKLPCQNKIAMSRWPHARSPLPGQKSRSALTRRSLPTLLRMSPATGSPSTDVSSEVSLLFSYPRCSEAGSPPEPSPSTQGATPWCPERGRTPGPGGTRRERARRDERIA